GSPCLVHLISNVSIFLFFPMTGTNSFTNSDAAECYGLPASEMVTWIKDFSNTYEAATSRDVIYTTTSWWSTCTGNSASFADDNPLWIADWASTLGPLPARWEYTSFWQYADSGPNPGDSDLWNGDLSGLHMRWLLAL
ncbi:glycoside hydrolase superfamily, partial [Pisolithus croceorrhizus]